MATPSQGLIKCKICGKRADQAHKAYRQLCDECAKKRQVEYQRRYRERQKLLAKPVICKGCGKTFTTERIGRSWRCPECLAKYHREHREAKREWHANYSRTYRQKLRREYNKRMVERRRHLITEMTPDELVAFRNAEKAKTKRLNAALKAEVFSAYGGWKCACCGETEPNFLTIDHMLNNGSQMRREGVHGHSTQFYRWLKKNSFPPNFQVLCMNCQFGKRMNGGICPHQARCND